MDKLRTYIEGMDEILHGGIPRGSTVILSGAPGTGKSIFVTQLMFNNVRRGARCIYFTTLTEPTAKMVQYSQDLKFFETELIGRQFHFVDISNILRTKGLQSTLEFIIETIEKEQPQIIAIDSFRAIHDLIESPNEARLFLYDLSAHLSAWSVTSFLIGEYSHEESVGSSEFSIADCIIELGYSYSVLRHIRELEILKMRGSSFNSGKHFYEITSSGITAYQRVGTIEEEEHIEVRSQLSSGIPGLNDMLNGGIPELSPTIIMGGTGIGKTLLSLHFITQAPRQGDRAIIIAFDQRPRHIQSQAENFGMQIGGDSGADIIYMNPIEMVPSKWLDTAKKLVEKTGAKRMLLDSLTTLSLAIPDERLFRELIYTAAKMLRSLGVTLIATMETPELLIATALPVSGVSEAFDNVILMRYIEIESQLRRAILVLKMRDSQHSNELREFTITETGIHLGEPFSQYLGVLSGLPTPAR